MPLVTAAEAKARGVGLDLADSDLQTLLDREEAEIVRRFGANYQSGQTVSEDLRPNGRSLYLKRAASAVTSVTEYLYIGDTAPTVRPAVEYHLWGGEGRIERADDAPRWGRRCVVVYTPQDDTDRRKEAILDLARAAAAAETGGEVAGLGYRITTGARTLTMAEQREAAYRRLGWLS